MNRISQIILLILLPLWLIGQAKETISLTYDPNEKKLSPEPNQINLRKGADFVFTIKNVNSAVYKPVFKIDTRTFKEEAPAILATLIPQAEALKTAFTAGEQAPGLSASEANNLLLRLRQTSGQALKELERIKAAATLIYNKVISKNNYSITDQQKAARDTLKKFAEYIHYRMKAQTTALEENLDVVNAKIKEAKSAPEISLQEAEEIKRSIIESEAIRKKFNEITKNSLDDKDLQKYLSSYLEAQILMIDQIDQIILKMLGSSPLLNRVGTKLYSIYQEVNRNQQMAGRNRTQYRRSINFLLASLTAEDHLITKRFEADEDIVVFNMKLVDKMTGDTTVKKQLEYHTFGGIRFHFSTGFFGNDLTETAYYLETKDTIHKYIRAEERRSFDIAIGALLHIGITLNPSFQTGPVIGAALSPLDQKTRYLFGWSALFGKKKLFALSAGMSLAKMKVLSAQVSQDTETGALVVPATLSMVPTYERLQSGFFLGVSYNLSRK